MAGKPNNPDWKKDLEFFLSKGLKFNRACECARVSVVTARNHGYGNKRKMMRSSHDEIKTMREKGCTYKEIGLKTGHHQASIYEYCKLWEIKKGGNNG